MSMPAKTASILRACLPVFLCAMAIQCAAPIKDFYPDTYFSEDGIYENKPLGFLLTYKGNWDLSTAPDGFSKTARDFAKTLHKDGAELLFLGSTVEGTQGTRGIAINLNLPPIEYAQKIQKINAKDITRDLGMVEVVSDQMPMVKWEYLMMGDFHFVEFFFVVGTYDVRIAFWTKKELFERFRPTYEDIISSVTKTSRN
jgi:hypothetical protein